MGTCCRHEGCIAAMGNLLQAWGLGCCRHGGLVTGMGTCRGEGGRAGHTNIDGWGCGIVHQLAPPDGLYTVTLLHDI